MVHNPPVSIVREYLNAMVQRDVATASAYIHPEATIIYPGGKTFNAISTLAESSSAKFKTLSKTFERFDCMPTETGTHVVYVSGHLHGTWPDDTPFTNIRFIDRYEIKDNLIVMQEVWSDSAEFRLAKLIHHQDNPQ